MTVTAVRYQPPLKLGNAALRNRKRRDGFVPFGNGSIALGESSVTICGSLGKSRLETCTAESRIGDPVTRCRRSSDRLR